jgi:GT2 family glycosyltransferase
MNDRDFEVILVDDASCDGSPDEIKRRFPQVTVLVQEECFGAAAARNRGIEAASGQYLCFIDNDNVVDRDFLGSLVRLAASDAEIGCVAPKMYYLAEPERIYFAGAVRNLTTSMTRHTGQGKIDDGSYGRVIDIDYSPNAYMVKRAVIEAIGPVDPYFEMFFEDTDWFYRVRAAGWRIVLCPEATTYHDLPWRGEKMSIRSLTGCNSRRRAYLMMRNRTVFMRRYAGPFRFAVYTVVFLPVLTCGYSGIYICFGRVDFAAAAIGGMFRGLFDMNV